MSQELAGLKAAEIARLVRTRAISPVEVVQASLARIDASQATINSFITVCHDQALAAAREAEARIMRGGALPALLGVPFSAKDMISTAGVRTTLGSRVLEDNMPSEDAVVVTRLKKAGAILVGKTTTPEFAHSCVTAAPLYGVTRNPWDLSRTPGGSSGGAGASVAAGLTPLALATDSGGSTRIPAACTGVVGFKQTQGLVPDESTRDAFGTIVFVNPVTRDIQDAALLLDAVSGPHPSDPFSMLASPKALTPLAAPQGDLCGVRVGWMPRTHGERVAPEVMQSCETALQRLVSLGAIVEELKDPPGRYGHVWGIIQNGYRKGRYGPYVASAREKIGESFLNLLESGGEVSAEDVTAAMFERAKLFRHVQGWFDRYDVVISPTFTRTALAYDHRAGQDPVMIDGQDAGLAQEAWFPSLGLYNLTGHPAVSIPCGWARDGLPVAFQAAARWGDDGLLVRLAALYEVADPTARRAPPVIR
ncbi:MAG: amidase [Bordetella sp.]|nr:amidase [Bordetella sp.]